MIVAPRVLIHCVGSAGDVLPFIAIARALIDRGAEVTLATSAWFEQRVRDAGIAMLAVGTREDYLEALDDPLLWHPWHAMRRLWPRVLRAVPPALDAMAPFLRDRDTVLVGSTLGLAVRIAAEQGHPRTASVHLSPLCMLSAHDWPGLPWLDFIGRLPLPMRQLALHAAAHQLDRMVTPALDATRAALGLAPVRNAMTRWIHSPHAVIAAFPSWYAQAQPDWPANTLQAGFALPLASTGSALDPELEHFLAAGSAPVVFTAGTGMAQPRAFLECAVRAAQLAGCRAVLVSSFADQLPGGLPPGMIAVAHAAFDQLLPRASAIVHHGGIGTVATAMAAGIPQLISPLAYDQFDNAARVQRLGVGARVIGQRPGAWASALRGLVTPGEIHAQVRATRARIAREPDGAATIAKRLLELSAPVPAPAPNARLR